MKRFLFLLLICSICIAQEEMTISGYVKDAETGEVLIGANVIVVELKSGRSTNNYGFFSITVPDGEYTLESSYIGYANLQKKVNPNIIDSLQNITFNLEGSSFVTDEVVLKAKKEDANIKNADMGKIELETETLDQIPVLAGEKDILKTIQLLPGVQAGSEGTSGFYVRGGGPDQNLILLDEAVVYNLSLIHI